VWDSVIFVFVKHEYHAITHEVAINFPRLVKHEYHAITHEVAINFPRLTKHEYHAITQLRV
jgi:hypothetical protein